MSRRLGISALSAAKGKYDPGAARRKGISRFETWKEAECEDIRRYELLTKASGYIIRKCLAVFSIIETPASSGFMRELRQRLTAAIWRLVDRSTDNIVAATLIPRSFELASADLRNFDLAVAMSRVRSALNRAGAIGAKGWLIAGIHGEFEPETERFVLHLHCLASGEIIDCVERLRLQRDYQSGAGSEGHVSVKQRIRVQRKPLTNLPEPITYLLQSWWPSRRQAPFGAGGRVSRQRRKTRIPGPHHTRVLKWLYRQHPDDMVLLVGLEVRRGRLRPTRK